MNRKSKSRIVGWVAGVAPVVVLVVASVTLTVAEPPLERTIVHAVADLDLDRILVRWVQVEGAVRRYTHYDVLRREAGETTFARLNEDPVGALTTVAGIEALFNAPGNADALASIQQSFGGDYANDLLVMQGADASESAVAQYRLLPDQNYGAALAFGMGILDEDVVSGTTYVYEVWGLDPLGFRQERLGRATATVREPILPAPVQGIDCVEIDDARGDMAAHLRWGLPPDSDQHYVSGYDVYRVPADLGDDCSLTANGPSAVAAVRANAFPAQRTSAGRTKLGAELFASDCASCHAAPDPRNTDPSATPASNGVRGGTLSKFYRLQYDEILGAGEQPSHAAPALAALDPEDLRAIFDWIQEFHLLDDGGHTPAAPLVEGQDYCYQVYSRDLLGQHGAAPPNALCTIEDRDEPDVPWQIRAERIVVGETHETCEISWQTNDGVGDDTARYELFRMTPDPPRASTDPSLRREAPATPLALVAQPAGGDRVTYQDPGLSAGSAGQRYLYSVRAVDDAGNTSDFSGWVPCVPRDIVAPVPGTLTLSCCDVGLDSCVDTRVEPEWSEWIERGGAPNIIFDPASSPCPGVTASLPLPGDTSGARIYRAFDGTDFAAGPDFVGTHDEAFAPLIDSRVHLKARPFDPSGNFGLFSNSDSYFVKGLFPLPAPQIVSVALNPQNGHVEIKFRSLAPETILGFVLYTNHLDGDGSIPAEIGKRVAVYHPANVTGPMSSPSSYPFRWVVLSGAQPLASRLPAAVGDGSLAYDMVDELYILDVEPQGDPLEGLVLNLLAVGWTGAEGQYTPYAFGGQSDGVLEWPRFRTTNHNAFTLLSDLQVSYNAADETVDVEWTTSPGGCTQVTADRRHFVVFRQRGPAERWVQISPLLRCNPAEAPPFEMLFKDPDVEPGRDIVYRYTVIRLTERGEFLGQYAADEVTP